MAARNGPRHCCAGGLLPSRRQPQLLRHRSTPCAQLHALGDTNRTSVVAGYIATNDALFVTRERDCCTTIDNASVSVESPLL